MQVITSTPLSGTARYFSRPVTYRWLISIAVAALLTLAFNQILLRHILLLGSWALLWPLLALLFLINVLLCQLLSIGALQKPWLITLLGMAAGSQYFMQQYGVLIDKGMLVNALETDSHEVAGLLSYAMLPYFALYLLLPASLIIWLKPRQLSFGRGLQHYITTSLVSVALLVLLVLTQYQSYAGILREHRYLKHQAVPLNILNASASLLQSKTAQGMAPNFSYYAADASRVSHQGKPKLIIMVLGETIRADHLGINGYPRDTTPRLARRDIINFGAIDACGTATAVSVPCMFSYLNHSNYDETLAKNSDNLLDVLQRAGVKVLWRNNNSGCKSMCDRVETDHFTADNPYNCAEGQCPDRVLLHNLKQRILDSKPYHQPVFIVLHQLGAHGPEYFKRSLPAQKAFLPECSSNLLNQCERQHIVNAYDNAVIATDELLDETIALLEQLNSEFDTAMLYVSDHGESLGENGVYLHGLPYWMAPAAQTRVPMLMWFSDGYKKALALNTDCLKRTEKVSHDNLFDSVLSLYEVKTNAKRPELDIITPCLLHKARG